MPRAAVTHIVFMKFPNPTHEILQQARAKLLGMQGRVASLRTVEVGLDFDRSARAWDLALVTSFDSREAMDEYQNDPAHLEVLTWLRSLPITSAVVDYYTPGYPEIPGG